MEKKKNLNSDLEKLRLPLIAMGLTLSITITLAAGEFTSYEAKINKQLVAAAMNEEEQIIIPEMEQTPPPPPPQQAPPPQIEDIVEVEDDEVVEDVDLVIQDTDDEVVTFTPPDNTDDEVVVAKVEIFEIAQVQPAFPGGEEKLYEFLGKNLKYPAIAKESNIQGKVYVQFVVWTDGSIRDVTVLRGIGGGCDEEATRVVKMMPNWTPGEQMGKAVAVRYRLPIKFTLN